MSPRATGQQTNMHDHQQCMITTQQRMITSSASTQQDMHAATMQLPSSRPT